jgi:hypothetical protein
MRKRPGNWKPERAASRRREKGKGRGTAAQERPALSGRDSRFGAGPPTRFALRRDGRGGEGKNRPVFPRFTAPAWRSPSRPSRFRRNRHRRFLTRRLRRCRGCSGPCSRRSVSGAGERRPQGRRKDSPGSPQGPDARETRGKGDIAIVRTRTGRATPARLASGSRVLATRGLRP